jgi:ferric-dicitrate binding protein FerR (iron transport regulator)
VGDVADSTMHVSRTDDLTSDVKWSHESVMFRHTPVTTVLQTVSQWYGYHFRYADSTLGTRRVTMIVSMRSSAEALADLERVLEVNLTVLGDTITLVSQPVRANRSAPRIQTYDVWAPNREVGR